MSLRVKLVLVVILTILGAQALSTLGVSWLVLRQNDENAQGAIAEDVRLVRDKIEALQNDCREKVLRFAQNPSTLAGMKYLFTMRNERNFGAHKFILDRPKEEMAAQLHALMLSGAFDGVEVYDADEHKIIALNHKGDNIEIAIASINEVGAPFYKYLRLHKDQELHNRWEEGPIPRPVFSADRDAVLESAQWFRAVGNELALAGAESFPVRRQDTPDLADLPQSFGFVFYYKILDQGFVKRLSDATDIDISLFIGAKLTHGTLPELKELPLEWAAYVEKFTSEGDIPPLEIREIGARDYYQQLLPLRSRKGVAGAIVLNLSRQDTLRKANDSILMLVAVMAVCLALATPLAMSRAKLFSRRIDAILAAVRSIAAGNLHQRAPTSTNATPDELDSLAQAINHMAEDLLTSIDRHRDSAANYQELFDNAPEGVVLSTPDGKILAINHAGQRLLGYEDDEALDDKQAGDFYRRPEDREAFLARMRTDGFADNFVTELVTRSGKPVLVSISSRPLHFEGQPVIQSTLRDVGERIRVEEALKRTREELEQRIEECNVALREANEELWAVKNLTDKTAQPSSESRTARRPKILSAHNAIASTLTPPLPPELCGKRCLVVDNHEESRTILAAMLESLGLAISELASAPEALEVVAVADVDLIVMDSSLPELDGIETTRIIRQILGRPIPIILLADHDNDDERHAATAAGVHAILAKPILLSSLSSAVYEALSPAVVAQAPKALAAPGPPSVTLPDALPGVAIKEALARLGLSHKSFRKILLGFRAQHLSLLAAIEAALAAGNLEELGLLAHSLKGSAANVGADALRYAALDLERAARQNASVADIAPLLPKVATELDRVLASIATLET